LLVLRPKRFDPRPLIFRREPPKIYGKLGNLEVRLARSRNDLKRAQKLRFKVFYEEMSAIADAMTLMSRRDEDSYDPICDHLLVVENAVTEKGRRRPWPLKPRVVGTYRLLRQDVADHYQGFYTQGEYDVASLIDSKGPNYRFVELGRSCVLAPYRSRRTVELLWQGIWTYVREHGANVMMGCASFEGTDPDKHAEALSFLYHNALAPKEWRVRAHDNRYVNMNRMPADKVGDRSALRSLPPLIKGYLRLGAFVGDGAVIDHQFGTIDVLIILPVDAIDTRSYSHFGAPDELIPEDAGRPDRLM
jgi:putative hemolysin